MVPRGTVLLETRDTGINLCRIRCSIETCGASGCSVIKRSIAPAPLTFEALSINNETSKSNKVLEKRVFSFPRREAWTPELLTTYIIQALAGQLVNDLFANNAVETVMFLPDTSMATTSAAQTFFGSTKFQMGNGGLHGCTEIAIISKRAVYMVSGSDLGSLSKSVASLANVRSPFSEFMLVGRITGLVLGLFGSYPPTDHLIVR